MTNNNNDFSTAVLPSGLELLQVSEMSIEIRVPNGVTLLVHKNRIIFVAQPRTKSLNMIGLCGTFTRYAETFLVINVFESFVFAMIPPQGSFLFSF